MIAIYGGENACRTNHRVRAASRENAVAKGLVFYRADGLLTAFFQVPYDDVAAMFDMRLVALPNTRAKVMKTKTVTAPLKLDELKIRR